jgi:hypothetical protein
MFPPSSIDNGFNETNVLIIPVPLVDGPLVEEPPDLVRFSLRHTELDEAIPNVPRERVLPVVVDELPSSLSGGLRVSRTDTRLALIKIATTLSANDTCRSASDGRWEGSGSLHNGHGASVATIGSV